jgi:hypothetical protein
MNAFDKFVEELINNENYRSSESTKYSPKYSGNKNKNKNQNQNKTKTKTQDEKECESVRSNHNHNYNYNNNNICFSQLLFISQLLPMLIKCSSVSLFSSVSTVSSVSSFSSVSTSTRKSNNNNNNKNNNNNNNNRSLLFNENLKGHRQRLLCFSSVPSSVKAKMIDARKQNFKLNINKNINKNININININKLLYVRYADDFLLGVRGSHQDCVDLLNKMTLFLKEELNLNLSAENTIITNANKGKAYFIGTSISKAKPKPTPPIQSFKSYLVIRQSIPIPIPISIRLEAPLDKISHKLREAKILNGIVPVPRFIWLPNSKDQIIALYNSFYSAYINFYSCVHNLGYISSYLHFVLKTSCAKLLAAKFKLKTQNKVYAKYGKDLLGTDKIAFVSPTPVYKYKYKDKDKDKDQNH